MPLDAVVLSALCSEMEEVLTGARIDKITMPEKDMVILFIHGPQGNRKLLISARPGSARLHFTQQNYENPPQPPMFCMLLRKYLIGARISALEQPNMERLTLIHMDAADELGIRSKKTLAVELMGKALNIALIGEDNRILDCLRRVDYESGRRPMLPGLFYELPPKQSKPDFYSLSPDAYRALLASASRELPADKWLLDTFGGLSPLICRELASNGWDGLEAAMDSLHRRVREQTWQPSMLLEKGIPKDFSFMPVKQYGALMEVETAESFSSLLDSFYARRDKLESLRRRGAELHRVAKTARDRLLRKLAARKQELKDTENREEYRRRGDFITANIYRLKRGMASFEAQDYFADDCPMVVVPLDPLKTPQQNAALNYKLYNKAKTAQRVLTELIASAEEEAIYLETVLDELSRAETDRDLGDVRRELIAGGYIREKSGGKKVKLPPPRKPMRFVSDSGAEILVGRGNVQNDELTFRTARRTDLWFHVQKVPGSHVIVSQAEGEADELTLRQAAVLAVTHSQANGGGKTAVDYTMVRYVKKPSGAKPGRVIYTDYNTIIAEADEELSRRLQVE